MTVAAYNSASDLVTAIKRREVRAREVLDHHLERVTRYNPAINAVVALDVDRAFATADRIDAALDQGQDIGPLAGLPMTVKDSFETEGLVTTSGAVELAGHIPARDAVAVARLKAAGAIVFGKTNLPYMAGDLQSYNAVYGTTNNPWDVTRAAGGSSGGAGAALAAGLTPLELGSDIGGSIRNPAHFNGVTGHKPSFGIVPAAGHVPPMPGAAADCLDIGVMGPLARDVGDLELAMDVLAGPSGTAARGWSLTLPPARHLRLDDYRIGVWMDDPRFPIDSDMARLIEGALDALARAGAKVDRAARPAIDLADAFEVYLTLLYGALSGGLPEEVFAKMAGRASKLDATDTSLKARYARNIAQSHRTWLAADERRHRMCRIWETFFADHDAVIAPVVPTPAFPHDHSTWIERTITINGETRPYLENIVWAGLTGMVYLPSTVVPIGRTPAGLPVGVQIIGALYEDRTTLDLAHRLEAEIGGFEPPPGYR